MRFTLPYILFCSIPFLSVVVDATRTLRNLNPSEFRE